MPDSPTEDLSVSQDAGGQLDVDAAESSTAEQGSENKTVMDAVSAALDGSEDSPDSETQDQPAEADVTAAPEKEPVAEFSQEDMKRFHPKTQDRIRQILEQRDHANSIVREAEPKIRAHDKIVDYMGRHGLTPADFDNGMAIMAEAKSGDPRRALELLSPLVKNLMKAAGYDLPEELQAEVREGRLSQQRAQELSVSRAEAQRLQQQRELDARRRQEADRARDIGDMVNTAVSSVEQWQADKARSDPDWSLKQNRVVQEVELELRRDIRKYPRSAKEAADLCEWALKKVEAEMKSFLPKPRAMRTVPSGSAPSSISAKPKTALEAVNFGLAMSRG
jgi:hypothetical protein